jgi:hypothetical protein
LDSSNISLILSNILLISSNLFFHVRDLKFNSLLLLLFSSFKSLLP